MWGWGGVGGVPAKDTAPFELIAHKGAYSSEEGAMGGVGAGVHRSRSNDSKGQ